jgi:alpha-aminoadipate/glutamate carrier protein LysW
MTQTMCPECATALDVAPDVRASEILVCRECATELEVVNAAPLTVALAPEIEEDWGE